MGVWLPFYGLYKSGISPYEYFRGSLFGPLMAAFVSVGVIWVLNSIVPKGSIHSLIMFIVSGLIVLTSFTVISLRSEAKELLEMFRRHSRKREHPV